MFLELVNLSSKRQFNNKAALLDKNVIICKIHNVHEMVLAQQRSNLLDVFSI